MKDSISIKCEAPALHNYNLGLDAGRGILPFNRIDEALPEKYPIEMRNRQQTVYGKKIKYSEAVANIPVAFDIESTSYETNEGRRVAWMFVWQLYINGHVIMGRNWEQFGYVLEHLKAHFKNCILPIYIHNQAFEFSFMRKIFNFEDIFCVKPRYPLRASYKNIEFRDSLALSGLALANLGTKTKKLKGDFDYSLIRHEKTPLTRKEIEYCKNDVIVLAEYIQQKIDEEPLGLASIPMTRTGYVRRDCKRRMKEKLKFVRYCLRMEMSTYRKLEAAFMGGEVQAADHTCNQSIYGVRSVDLTSAHPSQMVGEFFPMSEFRKVYPKTREELLEYLNRDACIFCLIGENVRRKETRYYSCIHESKLVEIGNSEKIPKPIVSNGKLVAAGRIALWCNEVDYFEIMQCYDAEGWLISDMECAIKARLPKELVEAVLFYYSKKTELKGAKSDDEKAMYALMKQYINGIFGAGATKPMKDPIIYEEGGPVKFMATDSIVHPKVRREKYDSKEAYEAAVADLNARIARGESDEKIRSAGFLSKDDFDEERLAAYNDNFGRYLFYAWSVWTTSYTRASLFRMIRKVGIDFHYCDTDSIKLTNWFLHKKHFDAENRRIVRKMLDACRDLGIDPQQVKPVGKLDGDCHPLGIWDDEGEYFEFKTLGAKRYMYEDIDGIHITVAGMNKKAGAKYFSKFNNPFSAFRTGAIIPADESQELQHTFQDEPFEGMVTDYLGNTAYVFSPSGTHLKPVPSSMSMSPEYLLYLATLDNFNEEFLDTCC